MDKTNKFIFEEGKDYYLDKGTIVLTESYLIRRGKCCGSNCKHCPFWPTEKGNTIMKK